MGRGLERGAGCLPNLDPGQNAPLSRWCMQGTGTSHTYHLTTRHWQVHRVVYMALLGELIMQQERSSSTANALVWYYAPNSTTARRPGVEMMSDILLQPVTVCTERSTDQPCARDTRNTAKIFTHKSYTCVIRRLAVTFLNLGFIDLLSCTSSPPPSTTSRQRILVCPRTSKSWDCFERSWGFPNHCAAVRHLGNRDRSNKSTKINLVNRSSNKQSESINVQTWLSKKKY